MQRTWGIVGIVGLSLAGCRPSEPVPSYSQDLGSEDQPLLPTASTRVDPTIVKGTAEWHPFRKLDAKPASDGAAKSGATPGAAPAESDAAGPIRELLADFNGAVAEGKFDEAVDLLIDEQTEPAKKIIEVLPQLSAKLNSLAEALPGDDKNLNRVAEGLTLATFFKLEIGTIRTGGATEASAPLSGPGESGSVRFVLIKGDEDFWYIDHPRVKGLAPTLPAIQQSFAQFDALIGGIKSGQIAGEALAQQAAALDQMVGAMLPKTGEASAPPDSKKTAEETDPQGNGGN